MINIVLSIFFHNRKHTQPSPDASLASSLPFKSGPRLIWSLKVSRKLTIKVVSIGREINGERRKLQNPHYSLHRVNNSVSCALLIHLSISCEVQYFLFQLKTLHLKGFPGFSPWPLSGLILSATVHFTSIHVHTVLSRWNESTPNVPFWRKPPWCCTSNMSTHTEAPRSRKVCVLQPSFTL